MSIVSTASVPAPARRVRRSRRRFASIKGLLPLTIFLLIWQLIGSDTSLNYPRPSSWWTATKLMNSTGTLVPALLRSLETFALGLVIGVIFGVAIGLMVGGSRAVEHSTEPLFDFCRGLPVPVIIPIVILIAGTSLWPTVFIVVFGSLWPILLATVAGRQKISSVRLDVARITRMGPGRRLREVILPSVLPDVMVGIRVAASLSVVITIAVELLGSNNGAGFLLLEEQSRFQPAGMWALLIMIGLFGFLLNAVLGALEERVLRRNALSS